MIKREAYLSRIRPFIGKDLIKVLTGIRRSGKSVMLELIQNELLAKGIKSSQFVKFNFEDLNNSHLCTAKALHQEIGKKMKAIQGKTYLFFDEIQEVTDWEKCINSFRVEFDCDIYITGSNAKLLSGELATYLAGRYVEFVVYPFSFAEFSEIYSICFPKLQTAEIFKKYLILGGMPYLNHLGYLENPSQTYLQDLFNSVVLKDIVKRNKVRDIDLLERIIAYVSSNIGTIFSATSISKYFKSENRVVASETIINYLSYCIDAFLFYKTPRQDLQGKKLLTINEKYYLVDHGIREAVYGGNAKNINLTLENIVFMEALRRGYKITVGKAGFKEIDFICEKANNKLYIQVSYLLMSEETLNREFSVFDSIQDNYPKYVVSMDDFDMSRNGIKHRNIRDFLLSLDWN
ncbi:MAG: ATP-binding protein [Erysipelotrichales bacterium]|nr:ATP-binding protein [Erysipelotrichales bacterium]